MNVAHDGIVSNVAVKLLGLEPLLCREADKLRAQEERHLAWRAASSTLTLNIQIGYVAAFMVSYAAAEGSSMP